MRRVEARNADRIMIIIVIVGGREDTPPRKCRLPQEYDGMHMHALLFAANTYFYACNCRRSKGTRFIEAHRSQPPLKNGAVVAWSNTPNPFWRYLVVQE